MGQLIGLDSEDTVRNNLGILKRQGVILDYQKTDDLDDMAGVDFIVWVKLGSDTAMIPLQVKTGKFGAVVHKRKHGRTIPVVYIKHKGKTVEEQIINIIEMYKRGLIGK
jgi:hypothetical protein